MKFREDPKLIGFCVAVIACFCVQLPGFVTAMNEKTNLNVVMEENSENNEEKPNTSAEKNDDTASISEPRGTEKSEKTEQVSIQAKPQTNNKKPSSSNNKSEDEVTLHDTPNSNEEPDSSNKTTDHNSNPNWADSSDDGSTDWDYERFEEDETEEENSLEQQSAQISSTSEE